MACSNMPTRPTVKPAMYQVKIVGAWSPIALALDLELAGVTFAVDIWTADAIEPRSIVFTKGRSAELPSLKPYTVDYALFASFTFIVTLSIHVQSQNPNAPPVVTPSIDMRSSIRNTSLKHSAHPLPSSAHYFLPPPRSPSHTLLPAPPSSPYAPSSSSLPKRPQPPRSRREQRCRLPSQQLHHHSAPMAGDRPSSCLCQRSETNWSDWHSRGCHQGRSRQRATGHNAYMNQHHVVLTTIELTHWPSCTFGTVQSMLPVPEYCLNVDLTWLYWLQPSLSRLTR